MSIECNFTWIYLLSLALQILLVPGAVRDHNVFVATPSSENRISLANATFECVVKGVDSVGWYVNDEYVQSRHDTERNISFLNTWHGGIFHSVLTIHAIPINNGSKVECATYTYGEGNRRSSPAYLNIQGPPAAPSDVIIQFQDKDTIQLSWISPNTIVGVLITGFHVYWKNTRSREYKVVKIANTSLYDFTILNPAPCDMYEFKISAVIDEAGTVLEGNSSQPIRGNFPTAPPAINASSVKVTVEFKLPLIKLTLLLPVDSFQCQAANNFTVQMCASDGSGCLHSNLHSSNIEILENNSAINFMETTELLPLNHHYITSISAETNTVIGIANVTGLHTSTFDIQDVDILENPQGGLTVICYFAKGSEAGGCCVEIRDLMNYTIALRESAFNMSAITWLSDFVDETAEYNVFVYDYESNGICAFGVPAVEKSIKLNGKYATVTVTEGSSINSDSVHTMDQITTIIIIPVTILGVLLAVIVGIIIAICAYRKYQSSYFVKRKLDPAMQDNPAYEAVQLQTDVSTKRECSSNRKTPSLASVYPHTKQHTTESSGDGGASDTHAQATILLSWRKRCEMCGFHNRASEAANCECNSSSTHATNIGEMQEPVYESIPQ